MNTEVILLFLLMLDLTAAVGTSTSMSICSEDQFQCGSSCLDIGEYYDYDTYDYIQHDYNFYTSHYWSCDGECQDTSEQCHGECPEGWVYCGSQNCRSANSSTGDTWECGDSCIGKSSQCNTSCPPDHYPCCDTCSPTSSKETWQCGEDCLPRSQTCLGECSEGFFSCGAECREDGECIDIGTACNGSCVGGGAEEEMRRVCGDKCIDPSTSCNGSCPEDLTPCGRACVPQNSSRRCPCEPGMLPCGPEGFQSSGYTCIPQFCSSYSEPYCRINTDDNKQRCAEACFKYDQTTGALSTTQYPAPYLNNQDCGLDISAPEGYQIIIKFHDFQIDSSDIVTFYDTLTVARYDQPSEIRNGDDTTQYLSSNNNFKLTFKTDSSKQGRGFNATVQFIKVKQCNNAGRCILKCPPSYIPCNGYCVLETVGCRQQCLVFNQTTMTVTRQISDDYQPYKEDGYDECHITIHSPFKNESIHLNFHQFDTGSQVSSWIAKKGAAFYDGENIYSPLLEKRTGTDKTKPVLSSGSSLTIKFGGYSDGDHLEEFNATVSFIQINPESCPPGFATCGGSCRAEDSVCGLTCGQGPNPSSNPQNYQDGPTLFWECGDECLESGEQCDGACPPDHVPCGSMCHRDLGGWSRKLFYSCGDQCLHKEQQCRGQCPENYIVCGNSCRHPNTYRVCGDECLTEDEQCDGECSDGHFACGKEECLDMVWHDMASYYTCGHRCLKKDTPCLGSCPAGFKLQATSCGLQAASCTEDISLSVSVPTPEPSPTGFSPRCCMLKQVGGEAYMIAGTNISITNRTTCKDACIYMRMRDGHLFCFASGNLPVNCLNLESLFADLLGTLLGDLLGALLSNGTLTVPMYKDLRQKHGDLSKDANLEAVFREALAKRDEFNKKKDQKET